MTCLFVNIFKSKETNKMRFLRYIKYIKYQEEVCWNEIKYNLKYLEWIKKRKIIEQRKILRNKKRKTNERIKILEHVNDDIIYEIAVFLTEEDIESLERTSKRMWKICHENRFYVRKLELLFRCQIDRELINKRNINCKQLYNQLKKMINWHFISNTNFQVKKLENDENEKDIFSLKYHRNETNFSLTTTEYLKSSQRFYYFEIDNINIAKYNAGIGLGSENFSLYENFIGYVSLRDKSLSYSYSSNGIIRSNSKVESIIEDPNDTTDPNDTDPNDTDPSWSGHNSISLFYDYYTSVLSFFRDSKLIYSFEITLSENQIYKPIITLYSTHQSFSLSNHISIPFPVMIDLLCL